MGNIYFANKGIRFCKWDHLFVDKNKVINMNYLEASVTQIDSIIRIHSYQSN